MSKSTISPADEIWALIRETQRNLKQFSAEAEKRQAEAEKRKAEIDRIINKLSTENTKINESLKKTNEGLKKAKELFETQWGKLMESLVEGDLVKVLNERGIDVEHTYMNIKREHGEDRYEYDIVAGNGDEAVVVEVKTTLKVQYIRSFLEDLKKFSSRLSSYRGKTIYGAVAFLRAEEESSKYAERQGLFVIKATGNSAYLINKEGFKPKVFS